jgi:hypothetical protein
MAQELLEKETIILEDIDRIIKEHGNPDSIPQELTAEEGTEKPGESPGEAAQQ